MPVHCHRDHAPPFRVACPEFADLERARLVKPYVGERPIALSPNWHCHPIRVRHDSGATFGFRFEESRDSDTNGVLSVCDPPLRAFAYIADLGCWDRGLVERLMDVDLLALEFNYDPELLRNSSRPPWLIQRILGDEGHLSNAQAAALVTALLKQGSPARLRQLVLLHLSQECNSSELATASARAALTKSGSAASVFSAEQNQASPTFIVGEARPGDDVVRLVQASLF